MRTILQHLRSNVIAYLSLFTALGGTSYAAVKLPASSVTSREIKARSVHLSDLASDARPSSKSKLFRLAVTDTLALDPNTQAVVNSLAGAVKGEAGAKGDAGPAVQGPQGAAGASGVNGSDGKDGATGPQGIQGDPPGSAHIAEDGTVLWSSNGQIHAARQGDFYCIRMTNSGLSSGTVTLEDGGVYTDQAFVSKATSACTGYDLQVRVVRVDGPNVLTVWHAFFITLD